MDEKRLQEIQMRLERYEWMPDDMRQDVRDLIAAVRGRGEPVAYVWKDMTDTGSMKDFVAFVPPPYIPTSALKPLHFAPPTVADALKRAEGICNAVGSLMPADAGWNAACEQVRKNITKLREELK